MKHILFIFLLLTSLSYSEVYAQGGRAASQIATGDEHFADGDYDNAIKYYKKALKNASKNTDYKYKLAMAFYRKQNYSQAIRYGEEILADASKTPEVNAFRLLGNSYDLHGNYKKSIETLESGLEKYPKSGSIFLDLGLVELLREHPLKAINYWERGIEAEPTYPDNYFWAAKAYAESEEKMWALLYGEIFMNIERGTERFDEMSSVIFNLYLDLMRDEASVTTGEIKFERKGVNSFEEAHKRLYNILHKNGMMSFERGNTLYGGVNEIKAVSMMRKNFLELWLQGFILKYSNTLYKHQRSMMDLTFFEAYNYWLFSKASTDDFMNWMEKNSAKYDIFIDWFLSNPLKVDVVDYVVRHQFVDENAAQPKKEKQ